MPAVKKKKNRTEGHIALYLKEKKNKLSYNYSTHVNPNKR